MAVDTHLITRLLDRKRDLDDRGMAAEGLCGHTDPASREALLRVILDDTEHFELRDEAASSLGENYRRSQMDDAVLTQIPSPFRETLLSSYERKPPSLCQRLIVLAIGIPLATALVYYMAHRL